MIFCQPDETSHRIDKLYVGDGRLFRDGNINWGRIVTLLCFGYRMAVTVIKRGIRGFFTEIVGFVVRFVLSERIARWIADQGGWVSESVCYITQGTHWSLKVLQFTHNTHNTTVLRLCGICLGKPG